MYLSPSESFFSKVYFTDRSLIAPCIGSISMDGTERRNLVSEKLEVPNMLAVDAEVSRINRYSLSVCVCPKMEFSSYTELS